MKMSSEEIFKAVMLLCGPVEPTQITEVDTERQTNMETLIGVFAKMHIVIDDIAYRHKDSQYYSAKLIGQVAHKHIESMGIN